MGEDFQMALAHSACPTTSESKILPALKNAVSEQNIYSCIMPTLMFPLKTSPLDLLKVLYWISQAKKVLYKQMFHFYDEDL